MDQHLAELVKSTRVSYEEALDKCQNVEDFNRLVGRTSRMAQGAGSLGDQINVAIGGQDLPPMLRPGELPHPPGGQPGYGRP